MDDRRLSYARYAQAVETGASLRPGEHVTSWPLTGRLLRLARLSRHADGRYLFVPLDHSVSDGPIADFGTFGDLVHGIAVAGADALVMHKGRVRVVEPTWFGGCGLIIHLSASTSHAPDPDAKVLVANVEEAVRCGADAVSVHVNIGSKTEREQLSDLGRVAAACDRWGVPLLAMLYGRGPQIHDPQDPALLAHLVSIAADLGADIVKTNLAHPWARMADVVAASPIPVIAAGGPDSGGSLRDYARDALAAGCRGLAVGRRVFSHPAPSEVVRELARLVHSHVPEGHAPDQDRLRELAV